MNELNLFWYVERLLRPHCQPGISDVRSAVCIPRLFWLLVTMHPMGLVPWLSELDFCWRVPNVIVDIVLAMDVIVVSAHLVWVFLRLRLLVGYPKGTRNLLVGCSLAHEL
jgi:hypothetical protein